MRLDLCAQRNSYPKRTEWSDDMIHTHTVHFHPPTHPPTQTPKQPRTITWPSWLLYTIDGAKETWESGDANWVKCKIKIHNYYNDRRKGGQVRWKCIINQEDWQSTRFNDDTFANSSAPKRHTLPLANTTADQKHKWDCPALETGGGVCFRSMVVMLLWLNHKKSPLSSMTHWYLYKWINQATCLWAPRSCFPLATPPRIISTHLIFVSVIH